VATADEGVGFSCRGSSRGSRATRIGAERRRRRLRRRSRTLPTPTTPPPKQRPATIRSRWGSRPSSVVVAVLERTFLCASGGGGGGGRAVAATRVRAADGCALAALLASEVRNDSTRIDLTDHHHRQPIVSTTRLDTTRLDSS